MEQQIKDLRERAGEEIKSSATLKELDDVRVKFLGKKGELTGLLRGMSQLTPEERPIVGQLVNNARREIEDFIAERSEVFQNADQKTVPRARARIRKIPVRALV